MMAAGREMATGAGHGCASLHTTRLDYARFMIEMLTSDAVTVKQMLAAGACERRIAGVWVGDWSITAGTDAFWH